MTDTDEATDTDIIGTHISQYIICGPVGVTMAEPAPPAKRARLAPASVPQPDRILVPHEQEQQQQPGHATGFRVTADEFDGLQTLAEMPEHEPGAVPRYTVMLSEADLRDGLGVLRGGAEFVTALDLETLVRGVAACDFLGAGALPASSAVCARLLLPIADAAAAGDAMESFVAVMERTSFGPALWATAPLETVGRLSVGSGEQADEYRAVVRMARAELTRRIAGLPDLELAMLRAHAAVPVAGPARAELLRRHPQLTPMTDLSIYKAVEAFCDEDGGEEGNGDRIADFRQSPMAEAKCGPVGLWDVSEVTSMGHLFMDCTNFNEDISAWDVRRAENLGSMFAFACNFNQPLGAWDIRWAEDVRFMFYDASSFNQPLGDWAVRPGADTEDMFGNAAAFDRAVNAPWYT